MIMDLKTDDLIENLVSVIMPAFNCQDTILDAINSVREQTYSYFELIIVDDGSTDDTHKQLKKFQDFSNIIIIKSEINYGVSFSRNIAISKAKGQYIAFLDSDDTWEKDKLKIQVNLMKKNNYFCCHSTYLRRDITSKKEKIIKAENFVRKSDMLHGNKIGNLTGIYDAKKLGKIYQKKVGHEDYLMWIQIVNKAGFSYGCLDNLASYTVSKKGVSSNKLKSVLWTWNIYRNELNLNLIYSFICLIRYFLFVIKR
tara:strand:- start:117 stop:881 length:765 start_codon:yes stop_codon:yes gene_type:complete